MKDPDTITIAPPSHRSTHPCPVAAVPSTRKADQIKVALVAGSGPQLTGEITALLRRRLRIAALIIAVGLILYAAVVWLLVIRPDAEVDRTWLLLVVAFSCILTPVAALLALLLWSRLPLSLGQLRAIELIAYGVTLAFWSWVEYAVLADRRMHDYAGPGAFGVLTLTHSLALPWFGSIILYGTFIPNSWRRCAAFVGAMALTPLLIGLAMGLAEGVAARPLAVFLFETGWWMALGAACAVYGCHKISLLRQEAFEARKLGQYQLKQRLGAGGMGEVYLAEHLLLRRPCAIKLIRPDQAGDPHSLARFEREVRATATLTHWNTVEIYDYGHAADGTFYYVMEYLPGLSLQDLVERHGPLPPERAVHLLRQVCAALREAHGIGLIHRDIKPSNILACERGGVHDVAKLLDFGIVQTHGLGRMAVKLTQEGAVAGSPPYMSPEQAAGKETVDLRSDVYSLGTVAYFLLTGRPPFVRDTAMQVLMAHVYDRVVPPTELRPEIPADLEEVVLRCLEKDPEHRYPETALLERDLAGCGSAGQWDEGRAAGWWRSRGESKPLPPVLGQGLACSGERG
jgi:serine/threonine-protein kinase